MSLLKRVSLYLLVSLMYTGCSRPLQLSFNPPSDFAEVYTTESFTITHTKVMGRDVQVVINQAADYSVARVADDPIRLRFAYTGFRYDMSNMGQTTTYDSAADAADNDPNLAQVYGAMLHKPWYIDYGEDGTIIHVEGFAEIIADALAGLPEEMRTAMQAGFSPEALLSNFQATTNFYPAKPVKRGDQWTVAQTMNLGGMLLELNTVYTVLKRKNGLIDLEAVGDLRTGPEGSTLDLGSMRMTYQLTGVQRGSLTIDEESGWPVNSQLEQVMGGNVIMQTDAHGELEMKLDMESVQGVRRQADN